ncbi:MAG: HAMP domain-containing histidine kinase [Erysipelotrichaceae bacterium]|nr:HAMP domain-containing histidine kinase [Erysipelotrichaceae bacterium]MDY5252808.1 HAMP domain-containing sensor histidine kinase [Erysipelotrichaceae bacterium]
MKLKGKTIFNLIFVIMLVLGPILIMQSYDKADELIEFSYRDHQYSLAKDAHELLISLAIVNDDSYEAVTFDETVDKNTQETINSQLQEYATDIIDNYDNDPNFSFTYLDQDQTVKSTSNKAFADPLFKNTISYANGTIQLSQELSSLDDYISSQLFINNVLGSYDISGHFKINMPDDVSITYAVNKNIVPSGYVYYTLTDESIYAMITLIYYALIALVYGALILIWPIRHTEEFPLFKTIRSWKLEILICIYAILYSLLVVASVFCLQFTLTGILYHAIDNIDPATIQNLTLISNYVCWIVTILTISATFFSIKFMFAHGIVNYLKQHTIIGSCLRWIKHKFIALSELDLKDHFTRQVVLFILFNILIILVINIFFPVSFFLYIIYGFILIFFIKNKADTIKEQYDGLLQATKQISQGNLNADINQDLGMFNSIKDELNDIKTGLKKAVEEETKSQNMKTELISNVSHDLKTPLTCIKNYVYLLKEEQDTQKQQEYVQNLEQYTNRLNNLIEDLFEVSKVNSGNIALERVELNIVSLLEQTLAECSDSLESKQLNIIKHVPSHDIMLYLDGDKTYRIFENLLSNIGKYALVNSRVYIDILEHEEDVAIVFKNISQDEMNFTQDEIIERFVRGDKSRHESGSGLGLAIAKSFTEAQDGHFALDIDGDLFKVTVTFKKDIMS